MIVTVTPNPALDITYRLGGGGLRTGATNRVADVAERAGGKGLNVARVLAAHGVPVVALGLLGGATGDAVRARLDAAGVAHDFTPIAGNTRRTIVVVPAREGGGPASTDEPRPSVSAPGPGAPGAGPAEVTGLWEPGPPISDAEWRALRDRVADRLATASVLILAGSLPPGAPPAAYAGLIDQAHTAGVPVILDADGDALRLGLAARPTVAKPNAAELSTLTDHPVTDAESARAAARHHPHTDLVISLGPNGLVAVTSGGHWSARPPATYPGNATGAGDAAVAALALGIQLGEPWPARLARMTAWSAAAAAHPLAGEIDPALAAELLRAVTVTECASR